jgi:hypothetical protein
MESITKIMCPSSKAKEGALLLGVRQENGTIALLPTALPVTSTFLENAANDGVPAEQKFRFTNKCVTSGCSQWNGSQCGVAQRAVQFLDDIKPNNNSNKPCIIRNSCRWFVQEGKKACSICTYVVTEITATEVATEIEQRLKIEKL